MRTENFSKRVGKVSIPVADFVPLEPPGSFSPDLGESSPCETGKDSADVDRLQSLKEIFLRLCFVTLKEGCYTLSFTPNGANGIFNRGFEGTLRVEHLAPGIRFSGDFYRRPPLVIFQDVALTRFTRLQAEIAGGAAADAASDTPGQIPIFPRRRYHSYLRGTAASLFSIRRAGQACSFSLTFDQFFYQHPASGFSGTFPASPSRVVRFDFTRATGADSFTGRAFSGTTDLGTVEFSWISPRFRRATLVVNTLDGAVAPNFVNDAGPVEDFRTVFATAGWELTWVRDHRAVPLPAALSGVQNPNACWTQPNSHTLMAALPGYNPSDLDSVWRAHLIAVPATLGCSRGRMFDNGIGNPNNIAREGALTHSHDGYPAADSSHFGAAQGGQQRNFPRAFLRSAAHEVGHTFNQIHQELEGGRDNSIMTTTPSVADVLAAGGQSFPDDIHLGFNARVRRHLIHQPDPAVRPGAIEFFGAAVNTPEADQIHWPSELSLQIEIGDDAIALGEVLKLSWTLTNRSERVMLVPTRIDVESLTARVSATDTDGRVTFLRPFNQEVCVHNPLRELRPDESICDSTTLFWGRDGFVLEKPGRHLIEVIALWQIGQLDVGVQGERHIWVNYPKNEKENRIAALIFEESVGRAVAAGGPPPPNGPAHERIHGAMKIDPDHRVCTKLKELGLGE